MRCRREEEQSGFSACIDDAAALVGLRQDFVGAIEHDLKVMKARNLKMLGKKMRVSTLLG